MTKTLLIYNLIPEETKFYVIPDSELLPDYVRLLALSHNCLVNAGDENEGTEFITNALSTNPEYCADDCPDEHKCCLAKYLVTDFRAGVGPFSRVFYTGFVL